MTAQPQPSGRFDDPAFAWRVALVLAAGLTLARLIAIFATPLELYPDEAQYWLWSQQLRWGYVSKPPMIAWLIWATTRLGDAESWIRLGAPLVHAGAMLALFRAGARLYGARTGLLAAVLYGLMPAVQVSALFVATDAPLMLFLALSLWACAALLQSDAGRERRLAAAALGAALGLAFLAKFAAVFLVMGAVIHAVVDRDARRAWGGGALPIMLAALALVFAPNLIWQATNGFATVAHTTEVNARWSPGSLFHADKLLEFVLGQFGILGPIPFAVLLIGTVLAIRHRRLEPQDRMLLCLILPALVLVTIQSFLSRAHSHWAAASYIPGAVLAAAWLIRWGARRWTIAALAIQGAVAALLIVVVAAPAIVDASGNGRRLQRIRGWHETAAIVTAAARSAAAHGGLTAVLVEDRYLFNELAYYGRVYFREAGSAPLRMRPPGGQALNEAELSAPLRPGEGRRTLVAETLGKPEVPALPGEFAGVRRLGLWSVPLGGKRRRDVDLWIGETYRGPKASPTPP